MTRPSQRTTERRAAEPPDRLPGQRSPRAASFARPGTVKAKYDPDSSFHVNETMEAAG